MRKLERFDVMDYVLYEDKRQELTHNVKKIKDLRRIFLGDKLLFLFENTEIVKNHALGSIARAKLFTEHDLIRQLEVFNELIPDEGELKCTMIILNDVDWERTKRVKLWEDLSSHIYLILNDGRKVYGEAPETSVVNQHPCSMRLLKFFCGDDHYPVKIGSDYTSDHEYHLEETLSHAQQRALQEDLTADHGGNFAQDNESQVI